jgi:hypothetical protein
LRDPRAVESLIERLRDRKTPVRIAAMEALGRIGDLRAVGPLTKLLSDRAMGGPAEAALKSIGTQDALAAVDAWRGVFVEKSTRERLSALFDLAFPVLVRVMTGVSLSMLALAMLTDQEAAAAYRQHHATGAAWLVPPPSVAAALTLLVALTILAGFASRLMPRVCLTGMMLGVIPEPGWGLMLMCLTFLPAPSFPGKLTVDYLLQRFSWHRVLTNERLGQAAQNVWLLVLRLSMSTVLVLSGLTTRSQVNPEHLAVAPTSFDVDARVVLAAFLASGLGGGAVPLTAVALVWAGVIPSFVASTLDFAQTPRLLALLTLFILGTGDISLRVATIKRLWRRL